jgi:hypothetical protein
MTQSEKTLWGSSNDPQKLLEILGANQPQETWGKIAIEWIKSTPFPPRQTTFDQIPNEIRNGISIAQAFLAGKSPAETLQRAYHKASNTAMSLAENPNKNASQNQCKAPIPVDAALTLADCAATAIYLTAYPGKNALELLRELQTNILKIIVPEITNAYSFGNLPKGTKTTEEEAISLINKIHADILRKIIPV